jgi:hypothetical protein
MMAVCSDRSCRERDSTWENVPSISGIGAVEDSCTCSGDAMSRGTRAIT